MDTKQLAQEIIRHVGGQKNIVNLVHCATRLRFTLADNDLVNKSSLEELNEVMGVVLTMEQAQIIIGNKVKSVHDAIIEEIGDFAESTKEEQPKKEGNRLMQAIMVVPKVFTPILPAFVASSLLKALISILEITSLVSEGSSTFQMLTLASDVAFYFLPVLIAVSAAKYFKANTYMAAIIAAVLLHPTFAEMITAGDSISLLGLPVPLVDYGSSLIPAIVGVWILSYVEDFFNKKITESLRFVFAPLFTFLVMFFIMFVVVGPMGYYLGNFLASAMIQLYDTAGVLAIVLIAVFKPFLVLTGMHYALAAAFLPVFTLQGYDAFYMTTSILPNLAQSGAAFGVFLRAKDKKLKSLALSTSFSAFMGVTEPALFGINLKYKKPLIGAMIGAGFGSLYAALMGVKFLAMANFGILGILGVMPEYMIHIVIAVIITLIVSAVASYLLGIEEGEASLPTIDGGVAEASVSETVENKKTQAKTKDIRIDSPLTGQLFALSEVDDPAFGEGMMGQGSAILPTVGQVTAPADAKIDVMFPTGHAVGMTTETGVELLIHVGIDTVNLDGEHYEIFVEQDQEVKKGDLLIEFDIKGIKEAGYDIITPVIVTNTDDYQAIEVTSSADSIEAGESLLEVK
ncbi:MAG: beta-glucoside-specific PTS transporter subunit IIABC [Atopostipes sp.]|nr:beta-glucoside-specific PTS transporter subunit IIABC [Atopostipes sp.]